MLKTRLGCLLKHSLDSSGFSLGEKCSVAYFFKIFVLGDGSSEFLLKRPAKNIKSVTGRVFFFCK
jgi:hypothetical protein